MTMSWKIDSLPTGDPAAIGAFFADLRAVIGEHRRGGRGAALLALDLDRFGAFSDAHGSVAATRALMRTIQAIWDVLPPGARMVRLGHDKFAVLLPGADVRSAVLLAERIRGAVTDSSLTQETTIAPLTVSIGVANGLGAHGEAPSHALERAGRALRRAKRDGRNRTKVARPSRAVLALAAAP